MKKLLILAAALSVATPAAARAEFLPAPGSSAHYTLTLRRDLPQPTTMRQTISIERLDASTVLVRTSSDSSPVRIALHDGHLGRIDPPFPPIAHVIDMLADVENGALRGEPRVAFGPRDEHASTLTITGSINAGLVTAQGEVMLPPPPPQNGPPPQDGPPIQSAMKAHLRIVERFAGSTLVHATGELRDTNRVLETWTLDVERGR